MSDNTYDDSYRGIRTQKHPRFGSGGKDISVAEAGRTIASRGKSIDAAVNTASGPAPATSYGDEDFAPAGTKPTRARK